jgi:hypothetical protein
MQIRFKIAACIVTAFPLLAVPAFSAGDGGGGGGGGDGSTVCAKGKVYDGNKCVPQQSGIDDDILYENGRDLALAGRYDEAITVLSLAADKTDPRILNYLGYAHRKSGRILVGLGYYQEALRNDPDYTLVREYLGEAHLQLGDVEAAREQLVEIEKRCGRGCPEYVELATEIEAFVKG